MLVIYMPMPLQYEAGLRNLGAYNRIWLYVTLSIKAGPGSGLSRLSVLYWPIKRAATGLAWPTSQHLGLDVRFWSNRFDAQ